MNQQAIAGIDIDSFWTKGYQVIPGMYTPAEIESFRQATYKSQGVGGDLLSNPNTRGILTDGRMVEVAKKLLGR